MDRSVAATHPLRHRHLPELNVKRLPQDLNIPPGRTGKRQAGLFNARRLVAHHLSGAPAEFFASEEARLHAHLDTHNGTILAHGIHPIDEPMWQAIHTWMTNRFLPMFHEQATFETRARKPQQLPDGFPALALGVHQSLMGTGQA